MSHSQEHIHLLVSSYPTLTGSALATFQIVVSDLSVEDSERWAYLFGAQVYCSNMLQPDITRHLNLEVEFCKTLSTSNTELAKPFYDFSCG